MSDEEKKDEIVVQALALAGGHELVLQRGADGDVLRFVRPGGGAGVTVSVTAEGIQVSVEGGGLTLRTSGALTLDAERVALRGEKGVLIESGGEARIVAAGALTTEGRSQTIHATRGDVLVKANDDVRLAGERVRLN
jgi:hypothetical protein